MRKILFLLFLALLLTGCGKKEESITDDFEETRTESIKSVSKEGYTDVTSEVYEDASIGDKLIQFIKNPFGSKEDRAANYIEDNKTKKDEVNKKAYMNLDEEERAEVESKAIKYSFGKYLVLIIIAIVVVVFLLLFTIINRNQSPKAQAPVVISKPVPGEPAVYHDANVNYERLLHDMCKARNLDYSKELSSSGGNARSAVERLS